MHVVWFAEIKWDYLRTRKQQLIRRRPDGVDLLFLEPFVRGRENRFDLREVDGIRAVTIPFIKSIPSGPGRGALNVPITRQIVDAAARARVRGHLRRAGIRVDKDAVFIISNVYAIGVATAFSPRRLVYDCNDAHADFPGMPGWTRGYQEETLRRADRVIVSAQRLREDAVRVRGGEPDVCVIGNGVDYPAFHAAQALRGETRERPRIGYLGAIAPWFDFDLMMTLAQSRPAWDFVLVGPVLPGAGPALERLATLSNVTVQPAVSHDEVPRVLSGFDVGLIPFRRNPLTAAVNPNKLYEYLATGLPVVSTPFSGDVVAEPDLVSLADDAAAFASACERMLSARREPGTRERLGARAGEVAALHDWDRIAREFWACACE